MIFLKNIETITYWINPDQFRLNFQIHNLSHENVITI
jgi:hypothetical protein